jgi:hypothetical protein
VLDRGPTYEGNPARHVQKQVVHYSRALTVSVSIFPSNGIEMPIPGRIFGFHLMIGAQVPSTPIEPADVTRLTANGDSGLSNRSPRADSEPTPPAAEKVSPPSTLITEHEVMLGTAATLARPPSFEDEDDAAEVAVRRGRRGWIAALARLVTPSPDQRRPRRHYPARLEFMEDARMAREMYRL